MINKKFETLFGQKTRDPDRRIIKFSYGYCCINPESYRGNSFTNLQRYKKKYSNKNICLAGGLP